MTKKTRTLLFLAATFLFLATVPSVVLYTQGYRVDTERKKITQTGGISVSAFPKSARVYIDGKLKKNTGFLSGEIFIQNVLPGVHQVTVKKDGYEEWQKELEVREKQVVEAHNIILLPKDPEWQIAQIPANETPDTKPSSIVQENEIIYWLNPETNTMEKISDNAGSVVFSPDKKKAAYSAGHELWIFYLENIGNQPAKKRGDRNLITRFSDAIEKILWMGSKHVIFYAGNKIRVAEIDDRDGINIADIIPPEETTDRPLEIFFSESEKRIYISLGRKVFGSKRLLP